MSSRRRRILIVVTVALFLLVVVIAYQRSRPRWNVTLLSNGPLAPDVQFRHSSFSERDGRTFDVVSVEFDRRKVRAELIDLPRQNSERLSLAAIAAAHDALCVINGGYFDANFLPIGLRIIDGQEHSPRRDAAPFSGYVTVDAEGLIDVSPARQSADRVRDVIQTGPFLVDPGGKMGIHSIDQKTATRTVIACDGDQVAWISVSSVTLRDLAKALCEQPEAIGLHRVERAINLDGGPSTGFVAIGDRVHYISEPEGPIRDALALRLR